MHGLRGGGGGGGGVTFTKLVRGCGCPTLKIWLVLYQFFAQFPTHQYTIFERKKVPQKVGTYTYVMSIWEPPTTFFVPPWLVKGMIWDGMEITKWCKQ